MSVAKAVVRAVSRAGGIIMMTGVVIMVMVIMVNVFLRVFGGSLIGTYELVQITSVVVVSLAVVYTAVNRMHVAVDIVLSRLPRHTRTICYRIINSVSAAMCAVLAWAVATYAWRNWTIGEHTSTLEIFLPPFRFFWALGCGLLCLVFIMQAIKVPENDPD